MTEDLVSLAVIVFVAFLSPVLCSLIPKKVIPETVLLIAAGAALGPHGLNAIHLTDGMNLLSDLGLGFLFLLAGYEVSPKNLSGYEGKRGAITWIITLAVAAAVVAFLPDVGLFSLNGIAVTIALTTTAMGTLMPILQERGILGTRLGDAIVSYGVWGELLPILSMALLLSTRAEWLTLCILALYGVIAVAAAVLPRHARKAGSFLYRFITHNADGNSQMVIRTLMLLLVGLLAVASVFDLDIVLGAFAGGFILRYIIPEGDDHMEMKHSAMAYGFFVPLFFVISGAKIDLSAVVAQPLLLVMFILLLLLVRATPIFLSLSTEKRSMRLSTRDRVVVSLYCTTALPIIVAVTSVAVSAGAMAQSTASVLVAAGGATVLIMPLAASALLQIIKVADNHKA